jgi:outer membrane protein assembly factor BamA
MLALVLLLLNLQPNYKSVVNPDTSAASYVILNHIIIEGNIKTKEQIILRELDVSAGDTLHTKQAETVLLRNRNKIFNTHLFVTVDLSVQKINNGAAYLLVKVTERWYIFPMIIFELADRNFNEWWVERGRDLRRTQYGFRIAHKNFRGRSEQLRATAQFGFTKRFELAYSIPYLDLAQKHGMGFDISYAQNKSVAYETSGHKLQYVDSESVLRNRFSTSIRFTKRNRYYSFHTLELKYNYNTIADTVAFLNPSYFLNAHTRQQYFRLGYSLSIDRRDIAAYPLKGHLFNVNLSRAGLTSKEDIHLTALYTDISLYRPITKKYFYTASLRGKTSSPSKQPYFNYRGFGYGQDYVRGYEYYVIDGQHYGLAKLTLKRELLNIQKHIPQLIPFRQFQTIPIAIYLKLYGDAGYVVDNIYNYENNRFSNTMLYGGGIGIDFVTFYNTVFRIDCSVNRSLERGFFFHFVRDI